MCFGLETRLDYEVAREHVQDIESTLVPDAQLREA